MPDVSPKNVLPDGVSSSPGEGLTLGKVLVIYISPSIDLIDSFWRLACVGRGERIGSGGWTVEGTGTSESQAGKGMGGGGCLSQISPSPSTWPTFSPVSLPFSLLPLILLLPECVHTRELSKYAPSEMELKFLYTLFPSLLRCLPTLSLC